MTIDHVPDYSRYQHLLFEKRDNGILWITINRPEAMNATNRRLHTELTEVWKDVGVDPEVRVAVITGAGRAFSAGGDLEDMVDRQAGNWDKMVPVIREAADLVYNVMRCPKPIISAINGVAVGAGLVVALLADISIMAEDARVTDGHTRLGVAAGDHAVIIWPLLCGMAKAKYYLLTCDFIDGKEAERIGLVSLSVPRDELLDKATEVAENLAGGAQWAIRWTKRALNLWLEQASPSFEASLGYEMLGFFGPDVKEGSAAIKEKRPPVYPSTLDG
ncbi:MAG: enoyl-CoA hydratase/isomerase family protein [Acidimicrobiia bacterium]|nr:enoyl-CoA hydratase/isomerase family protein [Acidimicrobiia bacterium]